MDEAEVVIFDIATTDTVSDQSLPPSCTSRLLKHTFWCQEAVSHIV